MSKVTTQKMYSFVRYMLSLQMILGVVILVTSMATTVRANAVTPEIPTVSDNENEFADMMPLDSGYDEKRSSSWQSLQGGWGKRGGSEVDAADGDVEQILPVLIANADPRSKLQLAFLTNAATLEHLAANNQRSESSDMDDNILNEKRNWKSMNVAWGKRRNGPTWNKFRGAWGKREPNWNNLKGMWGKRAAKDWQKLQGGWGKRSQQYGEMN